MRRLAITSALLSLVGCAPLYTSEDDQVAANTSSGQVNGCDVSTFSPAGRAVLDSLADFSSSNGSLWGASCDNRLDDDFVVQTPAMWGQTTPVLSDPCGVDGRPDCDPQFQWSQCNDASDCSYGTCAPLHASVQSPADQPRWMCLPEAAILLDRYYDIIVGAQHNVDITTIDVPDGRFVTAITNALIRLNAQQPPASDDPSAPRLHVRFVHADGRAASSSLLEAWTSAIGTDLRIRLSVASISDGVTWNHSKMVAADGVIAMVGGHNPYDPIYLGPEPVSDLSMVAHGKAAMVAQQYANSLWRRAADVLNLSTSAVSAPAIDGDTTAGASLDPYDPSLAQNLDGSVRVIGAATLGGIAHANAQPSDAALYALIGSAHKTVFLSQQGLDTSVLALGHQILDGYGNEVLDTVGIGHALLDAISRALHNGADVYIVLSNLGNGYGPGKSAADTAAEIRDYVLANDGAGSDTLDLCARLHVTNLRFSSIDAWPDLKPLGNHAKLVMVDDTTFYVGSQNLYPGGLALTLIPGLEEFGYFVDDMDAAARLRAEYWDPLWNESVRVAVSGSDAPSCAL